ncbi:unnamed protein product [Moneuplotes crassus]|uniref:Uncharacterized protein n=2 Tax=Euplotes crassus TaxID=5936 RepID=A0AAD1UG18_EUPCR|nr:unnamed protein product [Moneuplotes crassus]
MESTEEESKYFVKEGFLSSPSLSYPHIDLAPVYNFDKIEELSNKEVKGQGKKKKTKLKLMENEAVPYPNITIIDVKVNARGVSEDSDYLSNIDILKNIRRGNSFLKFNDESGKSQLIVGRKGMIKFYDIYREMLEEGSEEKQVTKKDGKSRLVEDKKKSFTQMNVTLAGPYKSFEDGYKVEMVKTLKANGENAQVSWNSQLGLWVFCSKNVAMLAKSRDDLEAYDQSENPLRFQFSKLIANCWFDKLEEIEANGINVEDLKKDIDGKTLIGEYCGDPNHVHLIFYPKIRIIFYTMVENGDLESPTQESIDSCLLPEKSMEVFKKYGLDTVTYESLGVFSTYASMKETLTETYKNIARAPIVTDEEGSVIYFVRRRVDESQDEDRVLSLGKLKTLEYRLYRKLREKTKGTSHRLRTKGASGTSEKKVWESVVTKFKNESRDLVRGIGGGDKMLTQTELNFYFNLAEVATQKLYDEPEQQDYIQDNYLVFLTSLIPELDATRLTSKIFEIQSEISYEKPEIS